MYIAKCAILQNHFIDRSIDRWREQGRAKNAGKGEEVAVHSRLPPSLRALPCSFVALDDEAKANPYPHRPDPLLTNDRRKVTTAFLPVETGLMDGDPAFRRHSGGHTAGPNWPTFLSFAERYLGVADGAR